MTPKPYERPSGIVQGTEMSLREQLARMIATKRVYASSDEGGPNITDAQVELNIVKDLLESMECNGETIYTDPVNGADPPDCIVRGIGGERVAIEVTEFVCRTAVEFNQKADRPLSLASSRT